MLRAHHWPIPGGDKGLAEDYPRRHKPRCLRQSGPLHSELRDGDRLHHNRASQQSNSGEVVGEPTNWVVWANDSIWLCRGLSKGVLSFAAIHSPVTRTPLTYCFRVNPLA